MTIGSEDDADGRMGIGTRERECERERPLEEVSGPGGASSEALATVTFSKGSGNGRGGEGEPDPWREGCPEAEEMGRVGGTPPSSRRWCTDQFECEASDGCCDNGGSWGGIRGTADMVASYLCPRVEGHRFEKRVEQTTKEQVRVADEVKRDRKEREEALVLLSRGTYNALIL